MFSWDDLPFNVFVIVLVRLLYAFCLIAFGRKMLNLAKKVGRWQRVSILHSTSVLRMVSPPGNNGCVSYTNLFLISSQGVIVKMAWGTRVLLGFSVKYRLVLVIFSVVFPFPALVDYFLTENRMLSTHIFHITPRKKTSCITWHILIGWKKYEGWIKEKNQHSLVR
jgi:hypothetical protein